MDLKFSKRVINLDLYGDKVEVSYPTARQLDNYLKQLDEIKDGKVKKSDFELTHDLLVELGLKSKHIKDMELPHMNELTQILLDVKKN